MTQPPPLPRGLVIGPEKTILAFTAALGALGAFRLWLCAHGLAGIPCVWKNCTGWPCFGCGGTRGLLRLLGGDLAGAWLTNPGALLAVLMVGATALYASFVVAGLVRPWRPGPRVWRAARWLVVFGLAANWIYLLAAGRV